MFDYGSKVLLLIHGLAATVLIGSTTHNMVIAVRHLMGSPVRRKLQKIYVRIVGWSYLVTFTLGLIVYPAFRLDVRKELFDAHVPLATAFFEIKEHTLGIGLLILAAYWPLSRIIDVRKPTIDAKVHHLLGIILGLIVWNAMLTGWFLSILRPVGGVGP